MPFNLKIQERHFRSCKAHGNEDLYLQPNLSH